MKRLLQHFIILITMLSRTKIDSQVVQSLPGCSDKCGNITIPYPFGIEENCYLDIDYRVHCTTLRLFGNTFKLLDISLDDYMHGVLPMAYACYNSTHKLSGSESQILTGKFRVSSTMNLLTRGEISTFNGEDCLIGGASKSKCNKLYDGSCFGYGCRQIPLPANMSKFLIRSQRNIGRVGNWSFNNCSYAFIVQRDQYVAKVARDCIELEGKKRPNMRAVKEELGQLRQSFT